MVLSDAGWRNSFVGDPGIIGSELSVNGAVLTVIGVAEEGFEGLGLRISQQLWVPKQMYQQVHPTPDFLDDRRAVVFNVVGRLKNGVTIDQAE